MINGLVVRRLGLVFGLGALLLSSALADPDSLLAPTTPAQVTVLKPAAPSRFAVATVNVAELLNRAPQSSAATEKLKAKYSPIEAELDKKQQAIQELQDQLTQLSEEERLQKERDLRSRQRNYSRELEDYREELRLARDAELNKVQKQVFDAINAVRVTEKIDVVLKESDYISANPQLDITQRVLDYLQQEFATANPAPVSLPKPAVNQSKEH